MFDVKTKISGDLHSVGNDMFKVNSKNTRARCEN